MEDNRIKLEVLRMVRDIVNNEYVDIRGKLHNQWVVESERAWLTEKRKLEYPVFPPFPSEAEIVRRAKIFLDFLDEPDPSPANSDAMCGTAHIEEKVNAIYHNTEEDRANDEPEINAIDAVKGGEKPTLLGRYLGHGKKNR